MRGNEPPEDEWSDGEPQLFTIPMRGNEYARGQDIGTFRKFTIPMRGNERIAAMGSVMIHKAFTIPMRGNEEPATQVVHVGTLERLRSP